MTGRMGDVIEVDLKDMMARKLLGIPGKNTVDWTNMGAAEQRDALARIRTKTADLKNIFLSTSTDWAGLTDPARLKDHPEGMQLITDGRDQGSHAGSAPLIVSTDANGNPTHNYWETGVIYVVPNINDEEVALLRAGGRLSDKQVALSFNFQAKDEKGEWQWQTGSVLVTAKDYAATGREVFFGDRPLDDPGYSAITLKAGVGKGQANLKLDVFKVEHRLKYLGFPAMGTGNPTATNNVLQDFNVDGKFAAQEEAALKLFEKVVRYQSSGVNSTFKGDSNGADGKIEADAQGKVSTDWLNAYNAPHWMQFFESTGNATGAKYSATNATLVGWENQQLGTTTKNVELYGTSWLRDLMAAKQYAPAQLRQTGSWFNGSVDANYGFTPKWNGAGIAGQHKTHDLGLAFDLGVSNYIDKSGAQIRSETLATAIRNLPAGGWSLANAIAYTAPTLAAGGAGLASVPGTARSRNDQVAALRDFLSMYAVTQSDGVTTQLQAQVVHSSASNLFGGLITGVLIGGATYTDKKTGRIFVQNSYPNMNAVLSKLGISSSPESSHHNHFHIYLKPPTLQTLPQNLLADHSTANAATELQGLLDHAQTLVTGEELMFAMDMPYVPAQEPTIVIAQAAGTAVPPVDFILKDCQETQPTPDNPKSAMRVVDPASLLSNYFASRGKTVEPADIRVTPLQMPKQGKLTNEVDNAGKFFGYDPTPGFLGNDQATFLAEYGGKRYKIILDIKVLIVIDEKSHTCPPAQLIRVKPSPAKKSEAGSSGYELNGVSVSFANLLHSVLGTTTGPTAQITLDTDAAGHGWYIDSTPLDSTDDYLPTSNLNIWQAKPGSEAAGKMDMLSVLLHEYGHALGLDHSADGSDFMAESLQPGQRKLPSAAELQLMAQLVAQLKGGANGEGGPIDPTTPALPADIALAGAPVSTQGWTTTGSVSTDAANGTTRITLSEAPNAQTSLMQAFNLGANDRYLSFTVDGLNLNGGNTGPADAFEVALLDPTTYQPMLDTNGTGSLGWTHSDASLNLQSTASGLAENAAAGVTRTLNADGSTTYSLDLRSFNTGSQAGRAVLLSFDLLGFGPADSSVTLRDIRLGSAPRPWTTPSPWWKTPPPPSTPWPMTSMPPSPAWCPPSPAGRSMAAWWSTLMAASPTP